MDHTLDVSEAITFGHFYALAINLRFYLDEVSIFQLRFFDVGSFESCKQRSYVPVGYLIMNKAQRFIVVDHSINLRLCHLFVYVLPDTVPFKFTVQLLKLICGDCNIYFFNAFFKVESNGF